MKKASFAFIIIGMIVTIVAVIVVFATGYNQQLPRFILWPLLIDGIVSTILCSYALVTMQKDRKSTAVGILLIFFCTVIGGIFYLIWEPKSDKKNEISEQVEQFAMLQKMHDEGKITDEQFDQLKKQIINK